jgi:membrane fusion protein (multidrug efflux system)
MRGFVMLFSVVLLAGCDKAAPPVEATAPVAETVPVAIQTAAAEARDVPTVVRATGTFQADESSNVTPAVPGQIVATPVNVGDMVNAGDVLVRLDDRDARLRLGQAEAALLQAQAQATRAAAEAKRNAQLVQEGLISPNSYEQYTTQVAVADAAVAQASAQVDAAKKAVADAVIVAPFAGHVSARPVAVGEYVNTSTKVATVVRIAPIKLMLLVPESEAAALRTGMTVAATVTAHPGRTFTGSVSALNVAIDPASRAMSIEARFSNADARLMPGMFGSAEVQLPAKVRGVFVPESAVASLPNGESFAVYAVDNGAVRVRVVQPGERHNGMVRLLAGLEPGVVVATSNLGKLFEGARVRTDVPAATTSSERPLDSARGKPLDAARGRREPKGE